jgi:ubiquinone/menaquinone biosynthesis C-methylase UbiE
MPAVEIHQIIEANHRIMNPLGESMLSMLGTICRLQPDMKMLDIGCGKGELLCRWARDYCLRGVGVDYFQVFLEAARARAAEFDVTDRLSWVQGDAAQYQAEPGGYDVVSCIGAPWIGGGFAGTLRLMQRALKPGGLALAGDAYWIDEPPEAAYDAWEIPKGTHVSLVGTLDRIESAGMELVEMVLATQEDWDRYEGMQWMAVSDYLRAHPADPIAREAYAWKARNRRAYLQYARRYFGWGVFVLRKSPQTG